MNNKNYYEILQIDKNASPEVIEKVYKILAKKYHPDLQSEENKLKAESILKEINEAYSVLSDPSKKLEYDQNLKKSEISQEKFDKINNENTILKNKLYELQQKQNYINENADIKNKIYYEEIKKAKQQAYQDAYIQDLKNRGYKIQYNKSFKHYFKVFIILFILILFFILILQIPSVRNFLFQIPGINYIVEFFENLSR